MGSAHSVSGAALAVLLLTIPVIAAVNPVDPTWYAGWYDDADTDQLVTQMMSADGLIGPILVTLVGFSASAPLVPLPVRGCRPAENDRPRPRAPPGPGGDAEPCGLSTGPHSSEESPVHLVVPAADDHGRRR